MQRALEMADSRDDNIGKEMKSTDKSKSHSPDVTANSKFGSEDWFRDLVGLPNWGIDPLKDINHVRNDDLLEIFGDKVAKKGYSCLSCKSDAIKRRIEQLYRVVLQQQHLPKEGFIPESFARAIVSEVLHYTSIDWAQEAMSKDLKH